MLQKLIWVLPVALVILALPATAEESRLVAVLPFTVDGGNVARVLKDTLEEEIRTVAGDALSSAGLTVLTGDTTLQVLADNGIDPAKVCDTTCHLAAARELKAKLFVSGTIAYAEGEYIAFVRLFDSKEGRQLASVQLEGKTVRDLRNEFRTKSARFFAQALGARRAEQSVAIGQPAVHIDIGQSPVLGAPEAKVTIVGFGDFQCPFCGRVSATIRTLLEKYQGRLRLVWKNRPLPFHPNALPAAKAALAAGMQGKFWEMHDKLFENQRDLSDENYVKWAGELGLDVARFKADVASPKLDAMITADAKLGASIGVNGTPTFFINGRRLVGAQPEANVRQGDWRRAGEVDTGTNATRQRPDGLPRRFDRNLAQRLQTWDRRHPRDRSGAPADFSL